MGKFICARTKTGPWAKLYWNLSLLSEIPWTKAVFSYYAPRYSMPTHGETVLTFSFRRSIEDESHGRVSWVSCTYEGRLWFLERYCCVVPHQVDGTFKRGFPLCGLSSFAGTIIGEVRNIAVLDALLVRISLTLFLFHRA